MIRFKEQQPVAKPAPKPPSAKPVDPGPISPSQPMVRINFEISRTQHSRLKIHAAQHGTTIKALLDHAITTMIGA